MAVKVLVGGIELPEGAIGRIEAVAPNLDVRALSREEFADAATLHAALADAEVVYTNWSGMWNSLAPRFAEVAPNLKWVQLGSAGADAISAQALASGVRFTTTAGFNALSISEYVVGCMVMFAKGWPRLWRNQEARGWERKPVETLESKTLGIVGFGHIGAEIAKRARPFGMRVMATRRSFAGGEIDPLVDVALAPSEVGRLLRESDFVVLSTALTAETRGLLDAAAFASMKPSAYLINVSRGEVLDEAALASALRDGTIAGAALDVMVKEPLPAESPLWELDNVILTPHISGRVADLYALATDIAVANLARYASGQPLENEVDPVRGY